MLEPVRDSLAENKPIVWTRVHNLPDFVYFNHSIHVQKGVGCASCHGRVDQMPMTWKAEPMTMEWCLNCHRNPELHLREQRDIFNMEYAPSEQRAARARARAGEAESYPRGSVDQLLGVPSMNQRPDADPTTTDAAAGRVDAADPLERAGLLAEPGRAGRGRRARGAAGEVTTTARRRDAAVAGRPPAAATSSG